MRRWPILRPAAKLKKAEKLARPRKSVPDMLEIHFFVIN